MASKKTSLNSLFFVLLTALAPFTVYAQSDTYVREHYNKFEYQIPMRDGVKLFTSVYIPKDTTQTYPILLQRTPYSVRPYGKDAYKTSLGPSRYLMEDGYIFVYQDVRGRYMSEGTYDNMRPHIPGNDPTNTSAELIDESSDTYDTIEWLLKNLPHHNGKVGQWGISYPGFYTAAALPEAHPALVASSPQAPISDFFFDDFHHMGAFLQSYTYAFPVFGHQTPEPTTENWFTDKWNKLVEGRDRSDAYQFYLSFGPLKNITEQAYSDNFFWKQVVEHPNYDEFWQRRSILPHLNNIDHAVMTVGGWFDAEDLYGPLNIYKTVEARNPQAKNILVMGPWSHGDWARNRPVQMVNHIFFGDSLSDFYQREIEFPFFSYYLKGKGEMTLPEAYLFDTGTKEWKQFEQWPTDEYPTISFSFAKNGKLLINETGSADEAFSYISDPDKPVPFRSEITPVTFTPRAFMTDDQRHASRRPDVLTFSTDVLDEAITLAGEIDVNLKVSISTTDADFVVKLIDVYPEGYEEEHAPKHINMSGYQQLVRSEVFRGRFRNSFAEPEPFVPGEITEVNFPLQDILHTFKPGHRIMIQIHSTWFPYIDRNPQQYVENIYKADEDDFIKSEITVYGNSTITVGKGKGIKALLPNREQ